VGFAISGEQTRERISAALDAIDAAHLVLLETPSDVVGNSFRVDIAERLETQDRINRGLMYRFFGEIADPPDGSESVPAVRGALCARLRVTPREVIRRFKLAARIRPRRSLTGPPVQPELPELAAAAEAGAVGEDHIRAICRAVDVLPACVSPTDVAEAERTLVRHATKLDAGVVTKLGQRIADYLNPDGIFNDDDRARRRGLRLGPQGPDGMSRLSGWLDPEARAYFEAIEAAVRPGRHLPDGAEPEEHDRRTPAQRCHDALKLGLETAIASGKLGVHRGHPVTVIATTTLAELDRAAHAVVDPSIPMPAAANTGGGSRLPMRDLIRMAAKAIHYSPASGRYPQACSTTTAAGRSIWAAKSASPPPTSDSSAARATAAAPDPTASNPANVAKCIIRRPGPRVVGLTRTRCFLRAVATMTVRAGANGTPWSPTPGDSAGAMATTRRRSTTPTTRRTSPRRSRTGTAPGLTKRERPEAAVENLAVADRAPGDHARVHQRQLHCGLGEFIRRGRVDEIAGVIRKARCKDRF
jgi:hypothetical protein